MEKAHKIVTENREEYAKLNNYLITAKKVSSIGASPHEKVTLQVFLTDNGEIKMMREL